MFPFSQEPKFNNPLELSKKTISAFSSAALQDRDPGSQKHARVPEVAYQDEFYRCAFKQNVFLLPEYTKPSHSGRVDFWYSQKQWMIELVRDATLANLKEHQDRFSQGGRYEKFKMFTDFIIINFVAPKVTTRSFVAEDEGRNRECRNTYHVILDNEGDGEMWDYTGEKKIETFYFMEGGS
jgi:hypothetical protein